MEQRSSPATGNSALADFLGSWPWFQALSEELQAQTLASALTMTVAAGGYVARAGDPSAYWWGVMHGHLQMYIVGPEGDETTLYCLQQGEWCGDGSLLKKERMQYDLRALTSAQLCLIPAPVFDRLRAGSHAFSNFLCDVMNARMGEFVGMLVASRLLGPEKRVAQALQMLTRNHAAASSRLPIHQQQLALICGLSRQRVNMALSALKRAGVIEIDRAKGHVQVHTERLQDYL